MSRINIGLVWLVALTCGFLMGRAQGKHFADRWYAENPSTITVNLPNDEATVEVGNYRVTCAEWDSRGNPHATVMGKFQKEPETKMGTVCDQAEPSKCHEEPMYRCAPDKAWSAEPMKCQ